MTKYLAPSAQGTGDGSSEANADVYTNINAHIAPGESIILIDSAGPYTRTSTGPLITAGGSLGTPCVIGGASAGARAVLSSNRQDPWTGGADGAIFFQLGPGADHLSFVHFDLSDLKDGWQVGAPVSGLSFDDIVADNVRYVIENRIVSGQSDASISGFTATNITATRYSKRCIELDYDTHDVILTDITGDSENTGGDPIAMGIHFAGTVHDVLATRCAMSNHYHDNGGAYWNGDSFAAEAGTYRFTFIDCDGFGNTDAGFDLKTNGVRMLRCRAANSKRNFRFWGSDVVMVNCVGAHPILVGGTGTQAQIHATDQADIEMSGCILTDYDPSTIIFDADQTGVIDAGDTDVTRHVASILSTVETNALALISGITQHLVSSGTPDIPAAPSGGSLPPFGESLPIIGAFAFNRMGGVGAIRRHPQPR